MSSPVIVQTSEPKVSVIVITFNGAHLVGRCIDALSRTSYPNYHVVLLDNGSTDNSAGIALKHRPDCTVIRTVKNLGFAGGNNVAIRHCLEAAGSDFIVLLNDDALILDPMWLQFAVKAATENALVGMVGFKVIDGKGHYEEHLNREVYSIWSIPNAVDRIEGCSLFIRAAVFHQVGYLDETYFMYGEEDDFEARAARYGFSLVQVNSEIYHIGGASSRRFPVKIAYFQTRNYLLYAIKNLSWARILRRMLTLIDILCNPFPLVYNRTDVAHVRMRNSLPLPLNFGIYVCAISWNLLHLPATLQLRMK